MFKVRVRWPTENRPRSSNSAGEIATRYGYPTLMTPAVKNIGIICLGGGYSISDIVEYCTRYGCHVPQIIDISVMGGRNNYSGDAQSADMELALDIQTAIGATKGMVNLEIYFCPNTGQGYSAGIQAVADRGTCCVGTTSWGSDEHKLNPSGRSATDRALAHCEAFGIPFFAASGDDGSSDGDPGNNTDYPASSPFAVGCGGTSLVNGVESAWSYGGGGFSTLYPRPDWQTIQPNSWRGVPDVGGVADPNTGYTVVLGGRWYTIGGTSAVSPLWAAGIGLVCGLTGKLFPNFVQFLYRMNNLTDITTGSNGAYRTSPDWDPCTGLGAPNAQFWNGLINPVSILPPPPPITPPPIIIQPIPVPVIPVPSPTPVSIPVPTSIGNVLTVTSQVFPGAYPLPVGNLVVKQIIPIGVYSVVLTSLNGGKDSMAKFNYPTLDQAQSALVSAVSSLTTGKVDMPSQVKDLYTLAGYALFKMVGDTNTPAAIQANVTMSHADMIKLLNVWKDTGNTNASIPHPFNSNISLNIDWKQLLLSILPIVIQAVQQGLSA